MLIKP